MFEFSGKLRSQDARVIRTRAAILDALHTSLQSKDFADITIQEICGISGISRTTFYMHFQDKYELMEYSLFAAYQDIKREAEEKNADFIRLAVKRLAADREGLKRLLNGGRDREVIQRLQKAFAGYVKATLLDSKNEKQKLYISMDGLAFFLVSGIIDFIACWLEGNFDFSEEKVVQCVKEFVRLNLGRK